MTRFVNFDEDDGGDNDDDDDYRSQCLLNEHDSCWLLASAIRFVQLYHSLACTTSLFLSLVFSQPNDESPTTAETNKNSNLICCEIIICKKITSFSLLWLFSSFIRVSLNSLLNKSTDVSQDERVLFISKLSWSISHRASPSLAKYFSVCLSNSFTFKVNLLTSSSFKLSFSFFFQIWEIV